MRALDRKLLRDARRQWAQLVTIALVVGSGIGSYVSLRGTHLALSTTQAEYYDRLRFADVFASLERAPERLREDLEALPGVALVETRITAMARVLVETSGQPPIGQLVSLPPGGVPRLGRLDLSSGRLPRPGRGLEAVLLRRFAERHDLEPGDTLPVVVEGVQRELRIVGTGMSPELLYAVPPGGSMADHERFAVVWMDADTLAPLVRLSGAFNEVAVKVQPGASDLAVRDALERVLRPHGLRRAYTREHQTSHAAVTNELGELARMAGIVPALFLGVAAFLLNVVLSRMVQLERTQIALLKAIGYSPWSIGSHYLRVVALVVVAGVAFGAVAGDWVGGALTDLYAAIFGLPAPSHVLRPGLLIEGTTVAGFAALVGAGSALIRVMRLPAAQAMRPEPPPTYRPTLLERLGAYRPLSRPARMVARELARRRLRTTFTLLGIAAAVGLLVFGRSNNDAVHRILDAQFEVAAREDMSVTLTKAVPRGALDALRHFPGVSRVEGLRTTLARAEAGHRARDVVVFGHPDDGVLRRVVDRFGRPVARPPAGALISTTLASRLGVGAGDSIDLELRDGARGRHTVRVNAIADEMTGLSVHLSLGELGRMLREPDQVSMALLTVDARAISDVERRLRDVPAVLAVNRRSRAIDQFIAQMEESMWAVTLIVIVFAAVLVMGVVYNYARVVLSQRERDLASLRVLGFTRSEISGVLLGEIAFHVLVAIPPGMLLGRGILMLVFAEDNEYLRLPLHASAHTLAYAALVTLIAGTVSALLVRRKVDRLDLIAVLKTREE